MGKKSTKAEEEQTKSVPEKDDIVDDGVSAEDILNKMLTSTDEEEKTKPDLEIETEKVEEVETKEPDPLKEAEAQEEELEELTEQELLEKHGAKFSSVKELVDDYNQMKKDLSNKYNITNHALNDPDLSQQILLSLARKQGLDLMPAKDVKPEAEMPEHLKGQSPEIQKQVMDNVRFVLEKEGYVKKDEIDRAFEEKSLEQQQTEAVGFSKKFFKSKEDDIKATGHTIEEFDAKMRQKALDMGMPAETIYGEKLIPDLYNNAMMSTKGGLEAITNNVKKSIEERNKNKKRTGVSIIPEGRKVKKQIDLGDLSQIEKLKPEQIQKLIVELAGLEDSS